jgi:glyoxylase-like metal-dependent hydrolase (beta-lactamase superfamily II)
LQKERNDDGKTEIVTANTTFEKEWKEKVGSIKLSAYHHSKAHTGGDAILHIENFNIVHMGDLVFNDVYPFVNKDDEASLAGWIEFLDYTYNKFDDETTFIFGHSDKPNKVYGNRSELKEMRNYLEALLGFVKKEITSGKSNDEIMKNEFVPGFENRKAMWKGAFQINLKAAIREVEEG